MKKVSNKFFVILSFIFLMFSVYFLVAELIYSASMLYSIYIGEFHMTAEGVHFILRRIIGGILFLFCAILFFVSVNFDCFKCINKTLFSKEYKEKRRNDRTAKKQAKLAREIAEKQAELEKMNENQTPID